MKSYLLSTSLLILSIVVILYAVSCNSSNETDLPTPIPPLEPIIIKIGFMADLTGSVAVPGPSSYAYYAFNDIIDYYNDNQIIPGVNFKTVISDNQYDPSRDFQGYERFQENGVELIYALNPFTSASLKPLVNRDKIVLFTPYSETEVSNPSGYVFQLNPLPEHEMMTLLSWIAINDWDLEQKGPAKIGAVIWSEPFQEGLVNGIERYVSSYPDHFQLVDVFRTKYKWSWENEIEALKGCDYITPPIASDVFLREYVSLNEEASFIGSNKHYSIMASTSFHGIPEAAEDMLVIRPYSSSNERGYLPSLVENIVGSASSSTREIEEMISEPFYFSTIHDIYIIMNAIEYTIAIYGYENFSSQTLYQGLQSFTINVDSCPHSFTETKRTSSDALGIYRIDATNGTLVRQNVDWIPIVSEP